MYKLFDGDYNEENAHLLENVLWEKLGKDAELQGALECIIENPYDFQEERCLRIASYNVWDRSETWDHWPEIPLSPQEIETISQVIDDPGNGPYFQWEPNFPAWLQDVQTSIEHDFDGGYIDLSEIEEKALRLFYTRFERNYSAKKMAAIYLRWNNLQVEKGEA